MNNHNSSSSNQSLPPIRDKFPDIPFPPQIPPPSFTVYGRDMNPLAASPNPNLPMKGSGQGGRHGCPECGRFFPTPSALDTHRRTHTGDKPFRCDLCGKDFGVKSNMCRHKKTHYN